MKPRPKPFSTLTTAVGFGVLLLLSGCDPGAGSRPPTPSDNRKSDGVTVHDANRPASEAKAEPQQPRSTQDVTVYITETGAKYHRSGCRYLAKSSTPVSLSQVKGRYGPCSVCQPPAVGGSEVQANPAPPTKVQQPSDDVTVYVTRTGAKYHRGGCRYLSKSMIPMSLKDAKQRYSACSVCRPP